MRIYCCLEHTDIAIDEIVDKYEQAPFINQLKSDKNWGFVCKFCGKVALYVVENEYSGTTYR